MIAALALSIVLLDTPTPTPTPTPGPINQPVVSVYVPNQPVPWPVPIMPTWGTGTPIATMYAATPIHGTEYPGQIATATAQIGQFTAPLSSIQTPVSQVIGAGPTETSGDISTGINPSGGGVISISTVGDMVESGVSDMIAVARQFVSQIAGLATYSPWMASVPVIAFLPTVIGMLLLVVVFIVRAGKWLWRWGTDFATFLGVWIRG